MEEIKPFSFLSAFMYKFCKIFIFIIYYRNIFFCNSIIHFIFCNNRLNRNLFKTKVCKMHYIFCKIKIMFCKCSSYKIICLISAISKFLEFWNYCFITSLSACFWTHIIINFFSSVKT